MFGYIMYKNKYLKYKKKYDSLKFCMNGGSDTINIEYVDNLTTQIDTILNDIIKRVNIHKSRNTVLKTNPTKETDQDLNALLTTIVLTLKGKLKQITELKESHIISWEEKIKRLGPTNPHSLSNLEKQKFDEITQDEQRRIEIRQTLGPDKNMAGYRSPYYEGERPAFYGR